MSEEEVKNYSSSIDAWDSLLTRRIQTVDRYHFDLETRVQYYDKKQDELIKVWEDIASIQNITPSNARMVEDAKNKVKELKRCDFQRRF